MDHHISPSGVDVDGWGKLLTSNLFGIYISNLPKAIVQFINHICIN